MNANRIGDVDQLAGVIDREAAERRLNEWVAQRDALDAKIVRQQALLDLVGIDSGHPEPSPEPAPEPDRDVETDATPTRSVSGKHIRRLILEAMTREPNREWSVDDLRAVLAVDGAPQEDTGTPLRRHLYDLRKDDKIVAVRTGVHRLKRPDDTPDNGRLEIT